MGPPQRQPDIEMIAFLETQQDFRLFDFVLGARLNYRGDVVKILGFLFAQRPFAIRRQKMAGGGINDHPFQFPRGQGHNHL